MQRSAIRSSGPSMPCLSRPHFHLPLYHRTFPKVLPSHAATVSSVPRFDQPCSMFLSLLNPGSYFASPAPSCNSFPFFSFSASNVGLGPCICSITGSWHPIHGGVVYIHEAMDIPAQGEPPSRHAPAPWTRFNRLTVPIITSGLLCIGLHRC